MSTGSVDPAVDVFWKTRFLPPLGLLIIASIMLIEAREYIDGVFLIRWGAVGAVLGIVMMLNYRRSALWDRLAPDGLPYSVHALLGLAGAWIGTMFWLDLEATRLDEYVHLAGMVMASTLLGVMASGSGSYHTIGISVSALTIGALGLMMAGQWLMVVAIFVLLATVAKLFSDSRAAYKELVRLREWSEHERGVATWYAGHDALTGLLNRRGLEAQIEKDGGFSYCFFIDLDHFKLVNDDFGHDVGDQVLSAVGRRLHDLVAGYGMSARVGGDEFVVLIRREEGAAELADRMLQVVREPIEIDNVDPGEAVSVTVSASIGVVPCSDLGSLRDLLRRSTSRLQAAKQGGRNRISTAFDENSGLLTNP